MPTDIADTLLSAKQGDRQALNRLIHRYRPYLRVLAGQSIRQQFHGRFDGSDAVQQTCMEACHGIEGFRGSEEREFHIWIKRILERNLANLMRDHTAQKRDVRREATPGPESHGSLCWIEPAGGGSSPASRVIRGEAAFVLAQAITQLSTSQETAIQMRYIEGFKLAEIAEYMGISTSSAAANIYRGLENLRQHLPHGFLESRSS